MLQIKFTNKMKRDAKRMGKRGKDMSKLTVALNLLANQRPMPERYFDHQLTGQVLILIYFLISPIGVSPIM